MTPEEFDDLLDDLEQAASLADGCDRSAREWRKEQRKEHAKALEAYRALYDRLADWERDVQKVMAEQCAPDEKHCTCVPVLRAEIERLTKRIAELEGATCEWQRMNTYSRSVWTDCGGWERPEGELPNFCPKCGRRVQIVESEA